VGDRYQFIKECPKCGEEIKCYYAPSSCQVIAVCFGCKTEYKIIQTFMIKEIKDEEDKKLFLRCFECYNEEED